jgi:alpha-tubulin suppressor-like RCC1 family protein
MEGSVQVWGGSSYLGTIARPTLLAGSDASFVAFALGYGHQCYVTAAGEAYCWGRGTYGALGNGSTVTQSSPVRVTGIADAVAIDVGLDITYYSTCAVHGDGGVSCWGSNQAGILGTGVADSTTHSVPARVPGVSGVVEVAIGQQHACARRSDGTVTCWGYNTDGQLGSGTLYAIQAPADVPGITTATRIFAGAHATCALLSDATLSCWGRNTSGELGDGTRTSRVTPLVVPGLSMVTSASIGDAHACAVRADGTARCWGEGANYRLGTGNTADQLWATTGPTLTGIAEIGAGYQHSCARLTDRTVRCWGENGGRQIGDGTTTDRTAPTSPAF